MGKALLFGSASFRSSTGSPVVDAYTNVTVRGEVPLQRTKMVSSVRLRNLRSPPPPPKRTKDGPPLPQLTPFPVGARYAARFHFRDPCPTSCAPFRGHLLVGFSDRPPVPSLSAAVPRLLPPVICPRLCAESRY
ncbi:hypothetical protein BHM03_00047772 [Ensete ventricosum]|uniref:Uncharacterized protein n=1 Tax=Ensete ventricosum TaxID=4639 RepID=A0A445MLM3_ENSVE|nr:hypothetical protein BHM03_00047772 [Ensete ventricosum]